MFLCDSITFVRIFGTGQGFLKKVLGGISIRFGLIRISSYVDFLGQEYQKSIGIHVTYNIWFDHMSGFEAEVNI